ncbi:MFS transporter [Spelaeicoccus albus]|uniref:MHS family proline/betaine transporter-like MFS transporter n=1 Tax=Spelaeicoccus albus TaxID=1280376 RepID=A0A7Z0CZX2_9MICO|nr:MFS transporter [Spelaeicoccus albus]NYI66761.1 MHS family proline/betaine transporter-like MFS transporter [Spelaeicoccus albus]
MSIPADKATKQPMGATRIIVAACVGNALEWYDIAVYSFFAVYIAKAFFTNADPAVSLVLTLGTFGVSFLIRPLGALVLGSFADRAGRKPALTLSLGLMVVGTLLICIMPPYATIGVLAPIGILIARLIQGFAAGGEFGSSTALMVEHLPGRRGFAASWQFASQAMSSLLAALIGTGLTTLMSSEDLYSWGFRIPFIVGLLVGPVGIYIRRHVPEPAESAAVISSRVAGRPVRTVFARQKLLVLLVIGVLAVTTCLNYMITYIPTYAIKTLHLPDSSGFIATIVAGVVLLIVAPIAGHYSDRIGQLTIMLPAAGLILVFIYPMFAWMVAWPVLAVLLVVLFFMALFKGAYYGPMAAIMASIFPPETRATGMALGYNVGVTIFGGFTPLVATWLINTTGNDMAPSFWVIFAAVVSTVSLIGIWKKLGAR